MKFYRTIFKDALRASWRNKYLWFFGLFATLWGSGAEVNLLFGDYSEKGGTGLFAEIERWSETGIFSKAGWVNIGQLATTEPFTFFILLSILLVVLVLFLFVLWVSIVSQAALVFNAGKIRLDKKNSFKDGLRAGTAKFWPVLFLNLGLRVVMSLALILLTLPVIYNQDGTALSKSGLVFVCLFLIFIPLSIIFSFIIKYAIAYVVIKGEKIGRALKLGWKLFVDNWLVSLEVAFLLFFTSFVGALAVIIVFLILMAPIMFVVMLFQNVISIVNVFVIVIAILVMYLIAIIIFGSFLTSFKTLSWTNLFIELISKGGKSKLNRVFSK